MLFCVVSCMHLLASAVQCMCLALLGLCSVRVSDCLFMQVYLGVGVSDVYGMKENA